MNFLPIRSSKGDQVPWLARLSGNRLLATVALVIGVYVAVWTILMVIDCWRSVPNGDQWDELISGREITWSWLVSQHNEHRILFPRLIFIADRWLSDETNIIDLAVNVAFQAGLTFLIFLLALGAGIRGVWEKIWAVGLSVALLFWAAQYGNFVWGFQVQFFGVVLAAAGTFTTLALGRPNIAASAAVVVLETVAVYTLSSGIIVPFLSIALAVWLGRPRIMIAVLTVAAFALLGSYLIGYHTPSYHSDPLDVRHHLGPVVLYALVYLGNPIGNAIRDSWTTTVAALAGAIGIAIFGSLGWTMYPRRRELPPHQTVLLALAGFVAAMSLLTAAGRVKFGLEQALSSRYATPVVAFWASLILLAAARAGSITRRQTAVMTLALPLQLLIAVSEPKFVADAHHWTDDLAAAIPALLANVADAQLLNNLYHPNPSRPLVASQRLRAAHTSIFHDQWADWLGTPLADHVTFADSAQCQGSFDRAEQVADNPFPGWRATGRAWSAITGKASMRILFADETGKVVGYGLGGLDPKSLNILIPSQGTQKTVWVGAFAGASPKSVVAYALLDDGPTACSLGIAQSIALQSKPNHV